MWINTGLKLKYDLFRDIAIARFLGGVTLHRFFLHVPGVVDVWRCGGGGGGDGEKRKTDLNHISIPTSNKNIVIPNSQTTITSSGSSG